MLELHDLFNDYANSLKQDWDHKAHAFYEKNGGEFTEKMFRFDLE